MWYNINTVVSPLFCSLEFVHSFVTPDEDVGAGVLQHVVASVNSGVGGYHCPWSPPDAGCLRGPPTHSPPHRHHQPQVMLAMDYHGKGSSAIVCTVLNSLTNKIPKFSHHQHYHQCHKPSVLHTSQSHFFPLSLMSVKHKDMWI